MTQAPKSTRPAHAKYGASSAHRWGACAGAFTLAIDSRSKSDTTRYSAEGTLGHTLAALCLTNGTDASAYVGTEHRVEGFDFTVDAEFAGHLQTYIDNIKDYAQGTKPLVEVEVNYSQALGVTPMEGFGTSDVVVLHNDELQVHDLKMGQGEIVEAEDNWQMMLYALGAYLEYGELIGYESDTKVTMVIHQPRIRSAPSEWSCTVSDIILFSQAMRRAVLAEKAALWDHTEYRNNGRKSEEFAAWSERHLVPGEKQCRWCPAKAVCPALRKTALESMLVASPVSPEEFENTVVPDLKPHVHASGADWLAATMSKLSLIRDWIKAVEAEVTRRMLAGQSIKGFKVVRGQQGDRAWQNAVEAEAALEAMRLTQDEMYSRKLITPTAAEKLAKGSKTVAPVIGERQWTKLQKLIVRAPGTLQVVPESHKAPAVTLAPVSDEFEDVSQDAQSLADDLG